MKSNAHTPVHGPMDLFVKFHLRIFNDQPKLMNLLVRIPGVQKSDDPVCSGLIYVVVIWM